MKNRTESKRKEWENRDVSVMHQSDTGAWIHCTKDSGAGGSEVKIKPVGR